MWRLGEHEKDSETPRLYSVSVRVYKYPAAGTSGGEHRNEGDEPDIQNDPASRRGPPPPQAQAAGSETAAYAGSRSPLLSPRPESPVIRETRRLQGLPERPPQIPSERMALEHGDGSACAFVRPHAMLNADTTERGPTSNFQSLLNKEAALTQPPDWLLTVVKPSSPSQRWRHSSPHRRTPQSFLSLKVMLWSVI
ncbi:hypothetical protein SKAU_G00298580 [Synaphobranchus kaupii]|uniref:Uncharacterized protein n=1 Tax=Synaphobranchus kaupii TaxID=118154 RepID=A0A9Q1EVA6_SYNKA|nr:hypothetical protein SKAU_G00298580 [Synaphobranchus kaupii]